MKIIDGNVYMKGIAVRMKLKENKYLLKGCGTILVLNSPRNQNNFNNVYNLNPKILGNPFNILPLYITFEEFE